MKAQGFDGISFAFPIDSASLIIEQLLLHRKVDRPFVGLKMINIVNPNPQEAVNGETTHVKIIETVRDSPAQKAGFKWFSCPPPSFPCPALLT
jgi:S1-C subfamily serine protease